MLIKHFFIFSVVAVM